MRNVWSYAIIALILSMSENTRADGLVLLPAAIKLSTPESTQQLLLQETAGSEIAARVTGSIEWSSSDPKIASITDGVVKPEGDGESTITANFGGKTATAKVVVTGMATPFERSFRNNLEPIFAKMGCNSGSCHGALAGKGGFRLSLRGYDPSADYFNIVKLERGRRVELSDPGGSLVLAKPTGAIPHKGGVRFTTDSREYQIIADWIASGAEPPRDSDARVESLEVLPGSSIHKIGQSQPIIVRARYTDGRLEDVTRWAKWSSADESVCRVNDQGVATVIGPGEGAVVAWYASKIAIARITVPYGERRRKRKTSIAASHADLSMN